MSAQSKTTRRVFMIQNAVASAAVFMAVDAQAQAMVSETDPQAAALGKRARLWLLAPHICRLGA
jgi:hypothetical protein